MHQLTGLFSLPSVCRTSVSYFPPLKIHFCIYNIWILKAHCYNQQEPLAQAITSYLLICETPPPLVAVRCPPSGFRS